MEAAASPFSFSMQRKMPLDLLSTSQESLTTWSFADDESYQEKFRQGLNDIFEGGSGDQPRGSLEEGSNNCAGIPACADQDHCHSSTDAVYMADDDAVAERFMSSINDFFGGSHAQLLDSSCQSLSVYDLATPLVKTITYDAAPDTPTSTTTNTTQENSTGESLPSAASREFQSSFREVMNSFSEIISAGRAFTPEECDRVKREIVRLRQLTRRMSASEKFGVDFAGFSGTAHRPGKSESGRRRALDLDQQKKQLSRILAWDVEGWKHKAFPTRNQSSDSASVDGFHDRKELREYIEQKYGMKRVSDHERSRRPRTPHARKSSMPLTRIDEDGGGKSPDGLKSPVSPRARGRVTTRSLEKNRRFSKSPSKAPNSTAEQSVSPGRQNRETLKLDAAFTRTPKPERVDKDSIRGRDSPSRRRCLSPSDRSKRAMTPTDPSRRAATPSDRSRRTATPTDRSRRTATPTDRSRRTTTPTDRSRLTLSPTERSQRASTPTDRSHRNTTPAAQRQERSTPTSVRRSTVSKREAKHPTTSGEKRRSKSPSAPESSRQRSNLLDATPRTDKTREKSNSRSVTLPSVPNLGTNESLDPAASRRSQRGSSPSHSGRKPILNPCRPDKTRDASKERREEKTRTRARREKSQSPSRAKMFEGSASVTHSTDAVVGTGDSTSKRYQSILRSSDEGSRRDSHRSTRSVGESIPSRKPAQAVHLSSLTTHLARTTTGRRRGRSCGRSLHSARSSSASGRVSRRSSIRGRSIGASSRNQRLSQKLNGMKSSAGDESQDSHRSPHQSYASSSVSLSTELSESRFGACTTDVSAPKTPQRRGSLLASTPSDSTAVTNSTASTAVAGNGEFTPYRRRTVRHDLADIIRGNATPTKASACSLASPASEEASAKHKTRSSIKMILSPQRRTIRDFLKSNQTDASVSTKAGSSSCNRTVG